MSKTIGLISANYSNSAFGELTEKRSLASLPFGGRYRLIDFPLSNMVNSGINTLGLIMPYNFRSLIDHVSDGKSWSLDHKTGGMFILPGAVYGMRVLHHKLLLRDFILNRRFLDRDTAEYVLLSGSNQVYNMDYRELIEYHEKSGAKVTVLYNRINLKERKEGLFFVLDADSKVTDILPTAEGEANTFCDCMIIDRDVMLNIIELYQSVDHMDLMDILRDNLNSLYVNAYEFTGYISSIDSVADYMKTNQDLLDEKINDELFAGRRLIYTKVQDEAPALYSKGSKVKNSLIATGCVIEGEVENCIVFRKVQIKPGVVVRNSVIMQDCILEDGCYVDHAIFDKYVTINKNVRLEGTSDKPLILGKGREL